MKTMKNLRIKGFTLVEIMIVVAIIGLLAAIAVPNFVRARATSQANACINNLRQIDGAKAQWALENGKVDTDTPAAGASSADISPYIKLNKNNLIPTCPTLSNFAYTYGNMSTSPTCSRANSVTPAHVLP